MLLDIGVQHLVTIVNDFSTDVFLSVMSFIPGLQKAVNMQHTASFVFIEILSSEHRYPQPAKLELDWFNATKGLSTISSLV